MITQKVFKHSLQNTDKTKLIRVDNDQQIGRYYHKEGDSTSIYFSVTNVLGKIIKNTSLEKWRKYVGKEKADAITNAAAARGKEIHSLCESYLLNEVIPYKPTNNNFNIFLKVKKILDNHVDNVKYIEKSFYSDRLGIAGTVDLVAEYKNKLSIIDFKTIKSRDKIVPTRIYKYLMQCVAYSQMIHERTGELIKNIVLIFGTEYDDAMCVELEYHETHIDSLQNIINEFISELVSRNDRLSQSQEQGVVLLQ